MVKFTVGFLILLSFSANALANVKINTYEKIFSNKLVICVDTDLRKTPELYKKTKKQLEESLRAIEKILPAKFFEATTRTGLKIVLLSEGKSDRDGMSFIPFNHSYWNREFEGLLDGSVVIHSPKRFARNYEKGLYDLIHEFAHFFHYDTLGYSNALIMFSFKEARKVGLYEGDYAAHGHTEYFAELSAMFFTRAPRFQSYDPKGFGLVKYLWNEKKSK